MNTCWHGQVPSEPFPSPAQRPMSSAFGTGAQAGIERAFANLELDRSFQLICRIWTRWNGFLGTLFPHAFEVLFITYPDIVTVKTLPEDKLSLWTLERRRDGQTTPNQSKSFGNMELGIWLREPRPPRS